MNLPSDDGAGRRERLLGEIRGFAETQGRRPRVMITGLGLGAQGEAAKSVATGYAGLGFDIDMCPLLRSPAEWARQAIENDVHAVGVGCADVRDGAPAPALLFELRAELSRQGADDIVVFDIGAGASRRGGDAHFASAQDVLRQIRKATSN